MEMSGSECGLCSTTDEEGSRLSPEVTAPGAQPPPTKCRRVAGDSDSAGQEQSQDGSGSLGRAACGAGEPRAGRLAMIRMITTGKALISYMPVVTAPVFFFFF